MQRSVVPYETTDNLRSHPGVPARMLVRDTAFHWVSPPGGRSGRGTPPPGSGGSHPKSFQRLTIPIVQSILSPPREKLSVLWRQTSDTAPLWVSPRGERLPKRQSFEKLEEFRVRGREVHPAKRRVHEKNEVLRKASPSRLRCFGITSPYKLPYKSTDVDIWEVVTSKSTGRNSEPARKYTSTRIDVASIHFSRSTSC